MVVAGEVFGQRGQKGIGVALVVESVPEQSRFNSQSCRIRVRVETVQKITISK